MGNVDKVDRTLALNEMMYHVRRDGTLRRRFVDECTVAWRTGTGFVAWPVAPDPVEA